MIANLQHRLDKAADPATRHWFERYLKHAIEFRGVRTPEVTRIVEEWHDSNGLAPCSPEERLRLAINLIREQKCEDKLAGILLIQKHLLGRLGADTLLVSIEEIFAEGRIRDWSTNDWLCARVLGPLVRRDGRDAAVRVAGWRTSGNLWQRRSSVVSLRAVVADPAYHPLISDVVAHLVRENARFIQTGIGWLIADLSRSAPGVAQELVERHFELLSPEVVRRHLKHLPHHERYMARKRGGQRGP